VKYAPVVQGFEFAAAVVMMTAPLVLAFVKSPALLALQVGVGIRSSAFASFSTS
jgi:hypothetical protein